MSAFTPHHLRVSRVEKETADAVSITVDVPNDLRETFAYKAGQYLTLEVPGKKGPIRRAYSLCRAPFEETWEITIKEQYKGQASRWLNNSVAVGDTLQVFPPFGRFTVEGDLERKRGYFFITAGSGITPVIAMIKELLEHEPQSFCYLLYGSRDEVNILFRNELDRLSSRYAGQFDLHHTLSQPDGKPSRFFSRKKKKVISDWSGKIGRIDEKVIHDFLEETECPYKEKHAFLCGPGPLMEVADAALRSVGFPPERIHREHFDSEPLPAPTGGEEAELTATLDGQDLHVHVKPGQTLLEAMMGAGHQVPFSCSSGACASCMAHLDEGEVIMDFAPALDKSEIDDGFILTCQAKAKSDHLKITY
ncbi:MAG: ferredoxin--NADP reductase [Saprospiraceae bacterium]|nr:ferredoxin--NADP reductase [Saprospiraceae bacterium]